MTRAVVVGSGPNGLAAAIRLAQRGVEVTVLERADRPGGGLRTSESTLPGLQHDDCSAVHPLGVLSPFLRSLNLERHGLRWAWPEIDLAHPLADGRAAVLSRSMERTVESLGEDGADWRTVFGSLVRDLPDTIDDILRPAPRVPKNPVAMARFARRALWPAASLVRRWRDEPARALFLGSAAHAFGRLDRPLTGAVGVLLTVAGHHSGWPVAVGGSEAIARALVDELIELGGRVRVGVDVVDGSDLAEFRPDLVLLDTSPRAAATIAGERMSPRARRALLGYRHGPAAFKLDLALDGPVPWTSPDAARAGTVHVGGAAAEIARAEALTAAGRMPEQPFVLVAQQHLADPGRATDEHVPLWAYAHVPHAWDGDATEAIVRQIERFAPGFRDRIVAAAPRGPAALEAYNPNYVGGDIGLGGASWRQLAVRPRPALNPYRLGERVFLCSAATPPGAGVHGMCGYRAAEAALISRSGRASR